MKQRTTFLLPQGFEFTPDHIQIGDDYWHYAHVDRANVQNRLILGLRELPGELQVALRDVHELHIRWVSQENYKSPSPWLSRLPPGLHVFFTPGHPDKEICFLLKHLFGSALNCHSVQQSFSRTAMLSERFSSAATYQYFSNSPSLDDLRWKVMEYACTNDSKEAIKLECAGRIDPFDFKSLDIDYDAISHVVTVTELYGTDSRFHTIKYLQRKDSVEVGFLQTEKPDMDEPEELKLGGYLQVIGEDENPSVTLFSFPSRHHAAAGTFWTSLQQPTGLHPKLDITIPRRYLRPPKSSCALHAYLTLPSALFIDRYQLSDPLLLASQNLVALRSLSGEHDLEAPDWVVRRWGSAALLELATPFADLSTLSRDAWKDADWVVTIPMHLRYLASTANHSASGELGTGYEDLDIPWPAVFWACDAEEGLKFSTNPFDRINLGYDGLFGPKTMFYHIPPAANEATTATGIGGSESRRILLETLKVPVLDVGGSEACWIRFGTLIVVVIGFCWTMWQMLRTRWFREQRSHEQLERKAQ